MIKAMSRLAVATAALGLVALPIVAQANTRAGDSDALYEASFAGPGLGRSSDGEEQGEGGGAGALVLGAAAVGAIVTGVLIATEVIGDDEVELDASPGT